METLAIKKEMRVREVIEIFNRDISILRRSNDKNYNRNVIRNAIDFYLYEMNLPDGHQSKIFSNYEYTLLINLYENEYIEMCR